jgi:Putative zinc-binding metallo-peptidase
MLLANDGQMHETRHPWDEERTSLLTRRISELGLSIRGTPVEGLANQLYEELGARGLLFRPPVYLSDQWGCPEGVPLIGVPFYLADPRLARIEDEEASGVEGDVESMRYLRHEAGHAFNYAYKLHERPEWRALFGSFARPYRERYRVNPFSREHVRHILGWYAQKHPDEDFAETFAVWLTPGLDWRSEYAGWGALQKLEYVDLVLRDVGDDAPAVPVPTPDDLPVEAMHYTVAEHYEGALEGLPLEDERHFDGDLRTIFGVAAEAPGAEPAGGFIRRHRREVVGRISYWTGEAATTVREFTNFLADRADALGLRAGGLEASTLIELTAFGTAVMMNYRHTDALDGAPPADGA